jgi:hypothetical protein
VRGAAAGLVVALVLAGALGLTTVAAPTIVYHLVLRTVIAFDVCWLLLKTVEHFGGASGWPFTTIAVIFALLVMFSNFAATILTAAPPPPGVRSATALGTFLALNLMTIVGIALAVWRSAD